MGYLDGFGVVLKKWFGTQTDSGARVTLEYPEEVRPKPERFHGRHVLNRYEDGMEKCIGCELCAAVCPAKCIYVRGRDNDPEDPTSPGERFGYVYEINYLRCIHCDLCVEACPTEAITETKLFEFSFTNREDAIYTKNELLVGDDGRPKQMPWENWDGGFDPARDTSGWMRATAPQGDANFKGLIAWAGELGYGVRPPERGSLLDEVGPVPSIASSHDHDHDHQIAHTPDEGRGVDVVEPEQVDDMPTLDGAAHFDAGTVNPEAAHNYEAAAEYDAAEFVEPEPKGDRGHFDFHGEAPTRRAEPVADAPGQAADVSEPAAEVPGRAADAPEPVADAPGQAADVSEPAAEVPGPTAEVADQAADGADTWAGDASTEEADPTAGDADAADAAETAAQEHVRRRGHFDAPDVPEVPKKKRRFRR